MKKEKQEMQFIRYSYTLLYQQKLTPKAAALKLKTKQITISFAKPYFS